MPNTFSQLYIHVIFTVKGRENIILPVHKEDIYKYITGIIRNRKQKLVVINGMPDHIHLLIGLKPDMALSNLIRDIKAISAKFINEKKWLRGNFNWQEGFGAFSYSHSQMESVVKYIQNQEKYHSIRSFKDEYVDFLRKFNMEFDSKYLFDWVQY